MARYCARSFDLPVTIARMGAAYSDQGGLPVWHLRRDRGRRAGAAPAGIRCPTARSTTTTSAAQLEPLLDVASVPATIVNWVRRRAGERAGVGRRTSVSCSASSAEVVVDGDPRRVARFGRRPRRSGASITGPCRGRLARRVPPRGRALLPGPGAALTVTGPLPDVEALLAEATRGDRARRLRAGRLPRGPRGAAREPRARRRPEPGDATPAWSATSGGAWSTGSRSRRGTATIPRSRSSRCAGPVDINGLPRTGTTALANMLSLDPQFRSLRGWEQVAAVPAADARRARRTDPRRLQLAQRERRAPGRAARRCTSTTSTRRWRTPRLLGMAFHGQQYTLPGVRLPRLVARRRHDGRRTTTTGAS